jgi:electron transfer flavoprotein beta subunit
MHIVVAAKQVLDPEGVNSYALWGRLAVDESGRSFTVGDLIPRIINAYDEQAMEAALRLKDAEPGTTITAITAGPASASEVLKRCVAMGADRSIHILDEETGAADGFRAASLLAAAIRELGDFDLVLCGRQGSDYDQGTVPGVLAELLDAAFVTLADSIAGTDGGVIVGRSTPLGREVVQADFPAVVSVSNELGTPRYPSSRGMMEARRKPPVVREAAGLLGATTFRVEVEEVFVPIVQGQCEMIAGATAAERAAKLMERLASMGVLNV